jgi:hypothetical protein
MLHAIVRLVALVLMILAGTAYAQQPATEMHRMAVNADDGSGWHPAASTKGAFSIRMPIPFNDFTVRDPGTGDVSHAIGGASSERIKFMAVELPITARTPADLGTIPKGFASNKGNKVSDLSRHTKDGVETLSFSVAGPKSGAHFRYIRTKSVLYLLTIEFPEEHRTAVAEIKDEFFDSFARKEKP